MGTTTCLLWLEGIGPDQLSAIPASQSLIDHGASAFLQPLALPEPSACAYQVLTGMGPGKTGRFDAMRIAGYTVSEDTSTPDGVWQRLLPDLISRAGHAVTFREIDAVDTAALPPLTAEDNACLIVRVRNAGAESGVDSAGIDALIRQCASLVGEDSHLMVLSGVVSQGDATVPVNINDFLADMGLLETSGPSRVDAEINWPETLAYGFGAGQIRINMRGREPAGVVAPGREFEEVCDALITALREDWRDPHTGEPVVADVQRKNEAYAGEYLFKAPDLIVTFRPGYSASPRARSLHLDGQSVPSDVANAAPGSRHTPQARLLATGPAITPEQNATGRLIDLAPTLLYLLHLPLPMHLDGSVLEAIITPEHLEREPIGAAQDDVAHLSEEEEVVIADRLQALGYLG